MRTPHTHHMVNIRRAHVAVLMGALALWAVPSFAQARLERLPDKDVKAIIDQVDHDRDKFEGNLDGKLKEAVMRTPTTEVKVSSVLQDYQDNVKKLQERFTADYSASAEVATVLRQAARIDKFMLEAPASTKGRSEWDREALTLKSLAAAYGTTFPMPEEAVVRRMNDKEAAGAAAEMAQAAKLIKTEFDKMPVTTLPKPEKDAIKRDVDLLAKQADTLKSRLSEGKPATSEMQLLISQVAVVQKSIDARMPASPRTNWVALQKAFAKLQQAFGLQD